MAGILADSHGHIERLRMGIETLKRRAPDILIHLGDVTDTLRLETVDACVEMLIENEVAGVMGNHEYSLVAHHFKRYPDRFAEATRDYVRSLPHRLEISGVCFTHFSPNDGVHGLYAPTDADASRSTLQKSSWPVLINGHSHEPRIFQQMDGAIEDVPFSIDKPFRLESSARYVMTCGAVEDRYCAFFNFQARIFEVISLRS